jgi:NosR/NirI family nitrous oxide reductase transcriptional regulator
MFILSSAKSVLWGKGGFFDMGDRDPVVDRQWESSVPGLYIVGDVAGTPDIKAALNAGFEVAHSINSTLGEVSRVAGTYDTIIVGAGPAGLNAANELRKLGRSYLILDRKQALAAIRAFEDDRPLYYPSTGEQRVKGEFWFANCSARELLELWDTQIASLDLNLHQNEEVRHVRRSGAFVVITSKGEYVAKRVIIATGGLTFLKKLGVKHEQNPRILHGEVDERVTAKDIVIHGLTEESAAVALRLMPRNTVTVVSPHRLDPRSPLFTNEAFRMAVMDRQVVLHEHAELSRIDEGEVVIERHEGDEKVSERIPNDIVLPFIGYARAMVEHREMQTGLLKSLGIRFENSWDWQRYTWLILALCVSGVMYFLKRTDYTALGLGTMLGAGALLVGGFYLLRSAFQLIDGIRFDTVKSSSITAGAVGVLLVLGGTWATQTHPLEIWGRSWGAWYPIIYSVLVVVFGFKAILRWRDSIQTKKLLSLIFFQVFFFWALPELILKNWLSYTIVYAWPLLLSPATMRAYLDTGQDPGLFYFWWAMILSIVVVPVFAALTGKKYCSWVCGCGGLAETVGDQFRHYAPKGKKNTQRESQLFYTTMFALVLTIVVGVMAVAKIDFEVGGKSFLTWCEKAYGWGMEWTLVSFIPIALYPFFGGKIWCRYWCPTAYYMHVVSKWLTKRRLGFFRIDTVRERCIACNMCSRYCEVGIDVMKFALKGEVLDTVVSSCIGCGICISVCPTDALRFGEQKQGMLLQIELPRQGG